MSSAQYFVLNAPYKVGVQELRASVFDVHRNAIFASTEAGLIRLAGPTLEPGSNPADMKATGSLLIFKAESLAAARKRVEEDVYYTAGVWDLEKLSLLPFAPLSGVTLA